MENYVIHFICGGRVEKMCGPYPSKEKAKTVVETQANRIKNEIKYLEQVEEKDLRCDKIVLRDKVSKIDACIFKIFKLENF